MGPPSMGPPPPELDTDFFLATWPNCVFGVRASISRTISGCSEGRYLHALVPYRDHMIMPLTWTPKKTVLRDPWDLATTYDRDYSPTYSWNNPSTCGVRRSSKVPLASKHVPYMESRSSFQLFEVYRRWDEF